MTPAAWRRRAATRQMPARSSGPASSGRHSCTSASWTPLGTWASRMRCRRRSCSS
eukprot:SM005562S18024  [mRNA]  locus=s5562:423:881:- [translate_table: standard]